MKQNAFVNEMSDLRMVLIMDILLENQFLINIKNHLL